VSAERLRLPALGRQYTLRIDGWYEITPKGERRAHLAHVLEWLEGEGREQALRVFEEVCADNCHAITMGLAGGARFDPDQLAVLAERAFRLRALLDQLCVARGWPRQLDADVELPDHGAELHAAGQSFRVSLAGWSGGEGPIDFAEVLGSLPAPDRARAIRLHVAALEHADRIARARAFELEVAPEARSSCLAELRTTIACAEDLARALAAAGIDARRHTAPPSGVAA
jgi:hypothetical protein